VARDREKAPKRISFAKGANGRFAPFALFDLDFDLSLFSFSRLFPPALALGSRSRPFRLAPPPSSSLIFFPTSSNNSPFSSLSTLSFSKKHPLSPLYLSDDAFRSRFLWARKPMLAAAAARLSCGGSLPPPRSLVW